MLSLNYTLNQAKKLNNVQATKELMKVKRVYPTKDRGSIKNLKTQRHWLEKFGGVFYGELNYEKLFNNVDSIEMSRFNSNAASKGEMFSMKHLWNQVIQVDFPKTISEIKVPVYFLAGIKDYNTPSMLVKKYFNQLKSPSKEMIWFKQSGHFIPFEEPEKFNLVMRRVLKECYPKN